MLHQLATVLERVNDLIGSIPAAVLIVIGVPLLVFGADRLVSGSVSLARRMGVSTLLIGLTIVAAGTSAPELAVNVIAATTGNPGISFGNVIGSNIANIGLVVGIGALIAPMLVHERVAGRDMPWMMAISAGTCVVALLPLLRTRGTGTDLFGYGFIEGILMLTAFVAVVWLWYRNARSDAAEATIAREADEFAQEQKLHSLPIAIVLLVLGLIALLIGGQLTTEGAVRTAAYLGVGEAVIGMTIVAIATSLPELFTVIVACRKGHGDLAVGNVVGSNIFNILLVLGVTALIADVPLPNGDWLGAGWQDLFAMLALTGLLWWFAITHSRHVTRGEGAMLLILYALYLGWSVVRELQA